jgi:hypothetical protein
MTSGTLSSVALVDSPLVVRVSCQSALRDAECSRSLLVELDPVSCNRGWKRPFCVNSGVENEIENRIGT